jgi:hypothetical protein
LIGSFDQREHDAMIDFGVRCWRTRGPRDQRSEFRDSGRLEFRDSGGRVEFREPGDDRAGILLRAMEDALSQWQPWLNGAFDVCIGIVAPNEQPARMTELFDRASFWRLVWTCRKLSVVERAVLQVLRGVVDSLPRRAAVVVRDLFHFWPRDSAADETVLFLRALGVFVPLLGRKGVTSWLERVAKKIAAGCVSDAQRVVKASLDLFLEPNLSIYWTEYAQHTFPLIYNPIRVAGDHWSLDVKELARTAYRTMQGMSSGVVAELVRTCAAESAKALIDANVPVIKQNWLATAHAAANQSGQGSVDLQRAMRAIKRAFPTEVQPRLRSGSDIAAAPSSPARIGPVVSGVNLEMLSNTSNSTRPSPIVRVVGNPLPRLDSNGEQAPPTFVEPVRPKQRRRVPRPEPVRGPSPSATRTRLEPMLDEPEPAADG